MEMYDVGQSSLTCQEAYALAELARLMGKPQAMQDRLKARGDRLAAQIAAHLWDESSSAFVNVFSTNGTKNPRISPTSFCGCSRLLSTPLRRRSLTSRACFADALQTRGATDRQAERMVARWLTNSSAFCVAPGGDFAGNDPQRCWWGLPSIEASDPAFPHGYWRGAVWGPMAQLTYWSLQQYDHVPAVRTARKGLAKQMAGLMMSQWDKHRHICENYSPDKEAEVDFAEGDCHGTKFYHWGALTGLIGLIEDDLF
eukprot:COSAG04_NODE_17_length_40288_cov_9.152728_3_plen_256_part_00